MQLFCILLDTFFYEFKCLVFVKNNSANKLVLPPLLQQTNFLIKLFSLALLHFPPFSVNTVVQNLFDKHWYYSYNTSSDYKGILDTAVPTTVEKVFKKVKFGRYRLLSPAPPEPQLLKWSQLFKETVGAKYCDIPF